MIICHEPDKLLGANSVNRSPGHSFKAITSGLLNEKTI